MMDVLVEPLGERRRIVRLRGRLDLVSAASVRTIVQDAIAAGDPLLVFDLSGIEAIDSSGIGALVGALKLTRKAGGEMRIAGAAEAVRTVLRLTTIDRILRPYDSVDAALGGL